MHNLEAYSEWVMVAELDNNCTSCDGWGDHGYEEDSMCLLVCHACGGTGQQ